MKLFLFDVDGTLTPARKKIEPDMVKCLLDISRLPDAHIGFVGGSDLKKQLEQIGEEHFYLFYWRFSENGLLSYREESCIHKRSFVEAMGEDVFKKFINVCLSVMATTDCPVKRGTFIEYRNGMLNISPIGRACSQSEREAFFEYDKQHKVRETMIKNIQKLWSETLKTIDTHVPSLQYSIGGEISVDVFPSGWNKTYCLQFIEDKYDEIHFFGDRVDQGGNDYEIYNDQRVIGHRVTKYQDTIDILQDYL